MNKVCDRVIRMRVAESNDVCVNGRAKVREDYMQSRESY